MRLLFCRGELWLEQRRNVEAVRWGFYGADFALGTAGDYWESRFHRGPFEIRIDFEVAEEFLFDCFYIFSVETLQVGTGTKLNLRHDAGEFWRVPFAVGHGARDRIDDDVL